MRILSFLPLFLVFSAVSAESVDTSVWLSDESLTAYPPEIAEEEIAEERSLARSPEELVWRGVNYVRRRGWSCGETYYPPAGLVRWDPQLEEAAQGHSDDMAENDFFDHTGSDGSTVEDRADDAGYYWRALGENIAAGYLTPLDVMRAWMGSDGHCHNIMNPSFEDLGVAVSDNPGSSYRRYWTMVLGAEGQQ